MNKIQRESLEKLEDILHHTRCICDPIEYNLRHRDLLYALAEHILEPLEEIRKKEKENELGSI